MYYQSYSPHQAATSQQIYRTISENQAIGPTMSIATSSLDVTNQNQQSTNKFGKILYRKATRVKEVVLQNIGKTERTNDVLFEHHEQNFYKQQEQAQRLAKCFKSHIKTLEQVSESTKNLDQCLEQVSADYKLSKHNSLCDNLAKHEQLAELNVERIRRDLFANLTDFNLEFANLKVRIAKRKRKMLDLDSSRRAYELALAEMDRKRAERTNSDVQHTSRLSVNGIKSIFTRNQKVEGETQLESAASRLVEEARLLKLREQYNYCKIMFESVNGELLEELPILYECKMKQLIGLLRNYFALSAHVNSEAAKIMASSEDTMQVSFSHHLNRQRMSHISSASSVDVADHHIGCSSSSDISVLQSSQTNELDDEVCDSDDEDVVIDHDEHQLEPKTIQSNQVQNTILSSGSSSSGNSSRSDSASVSGNGSPDHEIINDEHIGIDSNSSNLTEKVNQNVGTQNDPAKHDNQVADYRKDEDISTGVRSRDAKMGPRRNTIVKPLHKVKTRFKYLAEDVDELCFEADEIIQVIEFDESHEPEEGWLMGIREVNGQRGLFPENFTENI